MAKKDYQPKTTKFKVLAKKYEDDQEALDGEVIDSEAIESEDAPNSQNKGVEEDKDLGKYLTERQKLFCQYYASHEELLGNGVRSYAKAYGIDDVKLSKHYKSVNNCALRLLGNVVINRYIASLLDLKYSDEFLDSQLGLLALQNADPKIKIEAIKELNKLKQRIIDKSETLFKTEGPLVAIVRSEEPKKEEKEVETEDESDIQEE